MTKAVGGASPRSARSQKQVLANQALSLFLQLILLRHFEVKSHEDPAAASALFSVPDFVGDACKAIASRVRGAVASVQFDDFHKVVYT